MITKEEIQQLNFNEKLLVMEYLWDDLVQDKDNEEIVPEWHNDILKERMEKINKGEVKYKSLDSIRV